MDLFSFSCRLPKFLVSCVKYCPMEWPLEDEKERGGQAEKEAILMGDMSCRGEESNVSFLPSLGVVISGNYKWAPLQLEKEEEEP